MSVTIPELIPKNWGYETILHNGDYCAKLLVYERKIASSLHYHVNKHEVFYVASGAFQIEVDDRPARHLYPGDHVVLPPGTLHRLKCLEPGTIVESSSRDDPDDCVRLVPSDQPPLCEWCKVTEIPAGTGPKGGREHQKFCCRDHMLLAHRATGAERTRKYRTRRPRDP